MHHPDAIALREGSFASFVVAWLAQTHCMACLNFNR